MMASDTSVRSRAPAPNAAAQPMAKAGLFGDSPASTPPAAPITTRLAVVIRGLHVLDIQTIHAAADKPRVTAIARPRTVSMPGRGRARETVMITTTRPKARMASITRGTSTTRAPVTGSCRVAKPNTPYSYLTGPVTDQRWPPPRADELPGSRSINVARGGYGRAGDWVDPV